MKNKFLLVVVALSSVAMITSCSIEKRHYMKGYHVEWNKQSNKNNAVVLEEATTPEVVQNETTPVEVAPASNGIVSAEQPVNNSVAPKPSQENTVRAVVSNTPQANSTEVQNAVADQAVTKAVVKAARKAETPGDDVPKGLLIVLCFLLPWLAVGLATDWDVRTLIINLLLCLTCIGGIIHALIVVNRNT